MWGNLPPGYPTSDKHPKRQERECVCVTVRTVRGREMRLKEESILYILRANRQCVCVCVCACEAIDFLSSSLNFKKRKEVCVR
jgi:hypothetical protein